MAVLYGGNHLPQIPRAYPARFPDHHAVIAAFGDQIHGFAAKGGGQQPIGGGGNAAALNVAQHHGAGFDLIHVAVGAIAGLAEGEAAIGHGGGQVFANGVHGFAAFATDTFGHHHQGKLATPLPQGCNVLANLRDHQGVEFGHQFWNQNHIGSPGNPPVEGQVPGVAAHHFDHHDAIVAGGGKGEIVEGAVDGLYRRVKANRSFGERHIVVDGFGNTDQIPATPLGQVVDDIETTIPPDGDQSVEVELLVARQNFGHFVGRFGVTFVEGAKNGAAEKLQHI